MVNYHADKYVNFMTSVRASRPELATFADFTVAAVEAPGVDALLVAQLPGLVAARAAFRTGLVERTSGSGVSQTGTSNEDMAYAAFRAFLHDTNVRHLQPYFLDHAAAAATFYPNRLSGLTQAVMDQRLPRLTAYTEALEAAVAAPHDPGASALPPALGAQARALLTAYTAASEAKTLGRTSLLGTIADLAPDARVLAEALWDVHTAALFVHRRDPVQARRYFDYSQLRGRGARTGKSPKPAGKFGWLN